MGIEEIIGIGLAEGAADAGIGAGLAEAGAAGAADVAGAAGAFEGGAATTFAGGAADAGTFAGGLGGASEGITGGGLAAGAGGAEGSFAGGAEALGALGAEGSFAGGAATALAASEFAPAADLAAGEGLSAQATDALNGSFEEAATTDLTGISAAEPALDGVFADAPGAGEAFTNDIQAAEGPNTSDWANANTDALTNLEQSAPNNATDQAVQTTPEGDAVDKTVGDTANQGTDPTGRGTGAGAGKAAAGAGAGGAGQFNPGQLLSALKSLAGGPSRPSALGSANTAAQQLQDQANQLLANYNSGTLNPAQMALTRTALQANLNKIRQYYATSGRYNSTDRIQAENNARIQAVAQMEQFLQQDLQLGLQSLGQAGSLFNQVANTTIQADNAFRNSLNSALGNIMKLPFGGQASSGTPNVASNTNTTQDDFGQSQGGGGGGEVQDSSVENFG